MGDFADPAGFVDDDDDGGGCTGRASYVRGRGGNTKVGRVGVVGR